MEKILKSKIFVALTPIFTLYLFFVAGLLLSFVPNVSGEIVDNSTTTIWGSGYSDVTGTTSTEYIFSIKNAIGIWLIGLVVSLVVLLLCILVRKVYLRTADNK